MLNKSSALSQPQRFNLPPELKRWMSLPSVLSILAVILFLIAWNRGLALLYALFALVVAVLIVGAIMPLWNLHRVNLRRDHDRSAVVGDVLQLRYNMRNSGWLSRYMLEVSEQVDFIDSETMPYAFAPTLAKQTDVQLSLPCEIRGEFTLARCTLASGFPLGFWRQRRTVELEPSQVLIEPRTFSIANISRFFGGDGLDNDLCQMHSVGHSNEFRALREYRRGDNPKTIHWKQSAKRNDLVVREHEQLTHKKLLIVLDLNEHFVCGRGKHSTLEYMVSIAASIAKASLENGVEVSMVGVAQQDIAIDFGSTKRHYKAILDTLTRVQADGGRHYHSVVDEAIESHGQSTAYVFFDSFAVRGSFASNTSIDELVSQVNCTRIRFENAGFSSRQLKDPLQSLSSVGGLPTYSIGAGADLEALFGLQI